MAKNNPVLFDTNIISRVLKGQAKYIQATERIGEDRIAISSVTKMELLRWLFEYKAGDASHMKSIRETVEGLPVIQIDRGISQSAITLYQHHKQLSMKVPDMLVAATALCLGLPLFTTNLKDFQFVRGIKLYRAPNLTDNG